MNELIRLLELNGRSGKKRERGLTSVSDQGLGVREIEDMLEVSSDYIDVVKLSIGTALVTQNLKEKIGVYTRHDIPVYFGGTLFEIFAVQNRTEAYKKLLSEHGISHVEVSNGLDLISEEDKLHWVRDFKRDFMVLSEVGSKDKENIMAPCEWVDIIERNLEAGAQYVVAEGRQDGSVGLYRSNGEIRQGLVKEIIGRIQPDRMIFEAPHSSQRIYLINHIGAEVNLGNVLPQDVLLLECERRGLRYDTYKHVAEGKLLTT